MRKLLRTVPWVAMVLVAGACTGGGHDARSGSAPRSPAAMSSATVAADVPPPPRVGECRNTPRRNLGADVWVDRTPVVPCSRPHTLETVEVIRPAVKLTLDLAKQLVDTCTSPEALDYLGIAAHEVKSLILPIVYWPSPEQRAAGQSWLRCDVGVEATASCCDQLAPQTGSLRGAYGRDPARFRMCLAEVPDPTRVQRLVPCSRPHLAEALPTALALSVTHYPSPAVLRAKGTSGCSAMLADLDGRRSLVVSPDWISEALWHPGLLYGRCWIRRTSGLLPPVR